MGPDRRSFKRTRKLAPLPGPKGYATWIVHDEPLTWELVRGLAMAAWKCGSHGYIDRL